jgi:hypothetical protein
MLLAFYRAWRVLLAESAAPEGGGAESLSGTWRAEAEGRTLVVVLRAAGGSVHGRLDMGSDYCVDLAGELTSQGATGIAGGPLGPARFEALVRNGILTLGLTAPSAGGGQDTRLLLQMTRAGGATAFQPCPAATEHRDPSLSGTWRHASLTGVDGQVTADDRHLDLGPDGALAASHVTPGRWRSHGGVVYHQPAGGGSWEVLATVESIRGARRLRTRDGRLFTRVATPDA